MCRLPGRVVPWPATSSPVIQHPGGKRKTNNQPQYPFKVVANILNAKIRFRRAE